MRGDPGDSHLVVNAQHYLGQISRAIDWRREKHSHMNALRRPINVSRAAPQAGRPRKWSLWHAAADVLELERVWVGAELPQVRIPHLYTAGRLPDTAADIERLPVERGVALRCEASQESLLRAQMLQLDSTKGS